MRILLAFAIVFAVQVVDTPPVHSISTRTDVTPDNIARQPLGFRVESEARDDGAVSFDVFVSPGRDKISRYRQGRFEIARDELIKNQRDENQDIQSPLIWCEVRELEEDGVLRFSFGMDREFLPKASFEFRNFDPSGMPAMDGYRLLLREFAEVK